MYFNSKRCNCNLSSGISEPGSPIKSSCQPSRICNVIVKFKARCSTNPELLIPLAKNVVRLEKQLNDSAPRVDFSTTGAIAQAAFNSREPEMGLCDKGVSKAGSGTPAYKTSSWQRCRRVLSPCKLRASHGDNPRKRHRQQSNLLYEIAPGQCKPEMVVQYAV